MGPLLIADRSFDVDSRPVIMGTVNLSRDSTYRESIAVSTDSAVRKARVMAAEGADIVDVGAESSTARAARVDAAAQVGNPRPGDRAPRQGGDPRLRRDLRADRSSRRPSGPGPSVLNMTGLEHEDRMLDIAAEHGATVILCYSGAGNVREVTDVTIDDDPIPGLLEHFARRLDHARGRAA